MMDNSHKFHWLQAISFSILIVIISVFSLTGVLKFESPKDQTVINGQWASSFESHYNEELPVKDLGTNIWAALEYVIFNEGRRGVVIGDSGWLFTEEEFITYTKQEKTTEDHIQLISSVNAALTAQGIELLIAVIPAKARLYREQALPHQLTSWQENRLAYLTERLNAEQLDVVNPVYLFSSRKDNYFLKTDTHWTPEGAQLMANSIALEIKRINQEKELNIDLGSTEYQSEMTGYQKIEGDLLSYLPLEPYFSWLKPSEESIKQFEFTSMAEEDFLFDEPEIEIALVGTSYSANEQWTFADALRQSLGQDIANYAQEGKGPFIPMLEYLQHEEFKQQSPKLVIWEIPERYIAKPYDYQPHQQLLSQID